MVDWILYTREGCSLCEDFIVELAAVLGGRAGAVQVVDISANPDLEARYGRKIPVLTVEGEIVCMYRLDAARVRAHIT